MIARFASMDISFNPSLAGPVHTLVPVEHDFSLDDEGVLHFEMRRFEPRLVPRLEEVYEVAPGPTILPR